MPMPPWIWTAFWPTNLQALPTLALAAETAAARSAAVELQRGHQRHRDGLFDFHEHVDDAVLEHLEVADRLAELLALLGVIERRAWSTRVRPQASAQTAAVASSTICSISGRAPPAAPTQLFGADSDVFEIDFRGAPSRRRSDSRGG